MVRDILEQAIKQAGSEKKLGEAIGCTQNAVWQAKRRGRVSPAMAKAIDRWSDGKFSKERLCPEIFEDAAA